MHYLCRAIRHKWQKTILRTITSTENFIIEKQFQDVDCADKIQLISKTNPGYSI